MGEEISLKEELGDKFPPTESGDVTRGVALPTTVAENVAGHGDPSINLSVSSTAEDRDGDEKQTSTEGSRPEHDRATVDDCRNAHGFAEKEMAAQRIQTVEDHSTSGILLSVDDRPPSGAPLAFPNDDHLSSKTMISSTPVAHASPTSSISAEQLPASRTSRSRSAFSSLCDSARSLFSHRRSSSRDEVEHQSPLKMTSRLRTFCADAFRFAGQVLRIFIMPIMLALVLVTCHGASLLGRSCDFALVVGSGGNSADAVKFRYEAWKIPDVCISRFVCSVF